MVPGAVAASNYPAFRRGDTGGPARRPPERPPGAGAAPGLVNTETTRHEWSSVFVDEASGEMVEVTSRGTRLRRAKRRVGSWGRLMQPLVTAGRADLLLVTLTYRPGVDYDKSHLPAFMRWLRRLLGDDLYGVARVAEVQRRGAVHHHVAVAVRRGVRVPMPDKADGWRHGMTRVEKARRGVGYLVAYMGKEYQKDLPRGMRMFAVTVRRLLPDLGRLLRLSSIPRWLERVVEASVVGGADVPRRVTGRGWVRGDDVWRSSWRLVRLVRVRA